MRGIKFKCKQCSHTYKVKNRQEVECSANCCEIKYNMSGTALDFKDFKLGGKPPVLLMQFVTPEPPKQRELTPEEWQLFLESGYGHPYGNIPY